MLRRTCKIRADSNGFLFLSRLLSTKRPGPLWRSFQARTRAVCEANPRPQTPPVPGTKAYFSIPQLAERWCCSRASVYNMLRGEKLFDFAANGHRSHKIVPAAVVSRIEESHMRVFR